MGTNQETIESLTRLKRVLKKIAETPTDNLPVKIANGISQELFTQDIKIMACHIAQQKRQMNKRRVTKG